MKDRIPTKILSNGALRYGVYDDSGNLLRYEYIRPEDEPTQEGDPLCKETLLPDDLVSTLGLNVLSDPQIKDALYALYLGPGEQGYDLTFTYSNGQPVQNMRVAGIATIQGNDAYTDSVGHVFGVSTSNNPTISIDYTGYADVDNFSAQIAGAYPIKTQSITVPLKSSQTLTLTASQTLKFSNAVSAFSATVVGGGGGGGGGQAVYINGSVCGNGGGGGAGGYVATLSNVTPTSDLSIIVGAAGKGGAAKTDGTSGGTSSISVNSTVLVSSAGGSAGSAGKSTLNAYSSGGTGNGNGGKGGYDGYGGTAPTNGTGDFGGGGGGGCVMSSVSSGGSPYGGAGHTTAANGGNATGYGGGGGGGGAKYPGAEYLGGDGGNGVVILSWTNKS